MISFRKFGTKPGPSSVRDMGGVRVRVRLRVRFSQMGTSGVQDSNRVTPEQRTTLYHVPGWRNYLCTTMPAVLHRCRRNEW
jgi:hypothetical protein